VLFTYSIVPKGGTERDALVRGTLYASNLNAAKRYVPTATSISVSGRADLEVVLSDSNGNEVWRGPYKGEG